MAGAVVALGLPGLAHAATQGPDYIASDNVEFIKAVKSPDGLTAGARIIGHYMYVTSSKDLEIFDISKPEDPKMVGSITANIQFENEEVPTNGKLLGISSDLLNTGPECLTSPPQGLPAAGGCLRLYDVRDPANVKELPSVPGAGDHTSTCVLDCSYFYGSEGTIVDATHAFESGGKAMIIGDWKKAVTAQGVKFSGSCHNVHEVRPGVLLTACQPFELLSVLPQDGGSILSPKVLATGGNADKRFIHSARWPREGADKFALIGGETNFKPQCGPTNGAFMTYDASQALTTGTFTGPLDEIRPINGSYLDSNPPAQILGCSVHWYEEHQTFHDGGLVALAEYENGTRFLQIKPDGKIKEQGFFIPLGGSTSAPHWAPNSDILYAIDYERGFDVLRYKGEHYVPDASGNVGTEPGRVAGTEGRQPDQAPGSSAPSAGPAPACASAAGFNRVSISSARAARGVRFSVSRRAKRKFDAGVFQVSDGRHIFKTRRVARFRGKRGSFRWSGTGPRGQRLRDGYYFARFVMPVGGGRRDIRYLTLRRNHGSFSTRQRFYVPRDCSSVSLAKLSRPVFGGSRSRELGIAYRLARGADSVSVRVMRGRQVVTRFSGTGREVGKKYRLALPARSVPAGANVTVRITIRRANATDRVTLVAHRL